MKNAFKICSSQHGATCSLCQDTLLRHISQSRIFWYCPSCRQEMTVGEEQEDLLKANPTPRITPVVPQRQLAPVADLNQHINVSAS